jgi:short subunit dehydrogenase-like uncharacterized protein
MSDGKFEVLLYGATGFTGKLTAAYLDRHPALAGKSWAIAGRNVAGLEAVKATLSSETVEIVHCPLDDREAVKAMVRRARVVITTAGPFSAYKGEVLLGACAEEGVHYSDLSGEGFWQREMIEAFHQTAVESGAKIVLGGGVDSIPSDLGAHLVLNALGVSAGQDAGAAVTGVYTRYTGSFSGGTLASGKARQEANKSGRLTEDALEDPYLLAPGYPANPDEEPTLDGMPEKFSGALDGGFGVLLPFFMGKINAPVVRRGLALKGLSASTTYRECCTPGMWAKVLWVYLTRGFGYFLGEPINFRPKSGEGPPKWLLKQGGFTIKLLAKAEDGRKARAVISGRGDPGYGATSKMLAELALCLGKDHPDAPEGGGVLTPATALGDALVDQLRQADGGRFMRLNVLVG